MQLQVLLGKIKAPPKSINEKLQFEKILSEDEIQEIENRDHDINLGTKGPNEVFIFKTHFRNPLGKKSDEFILVYRIVGVDNSSYALHVGAKRSEIDEELIYDNDNNIFYDRFSFKKDGKGDYTNKIDYDIDAAPIGYIHPGNYYIKISTRDESHTMSYLNDSLFKVVILPSSLSMKDFIAMANELIDIRTDIAVAPMGKQGFYVEKNIESLLNDLKRVGKYLKRINSNPKYKIVEQRKKIAKEKIKKFDEKTIRQLCMNSGKETIEQRIRCESNDIYENRIIFFVIVEIFKKIKKNIIRNAYSNKRLLNCLIKEQQQFFADSSVKIAEIVKFLGIPLQLDNKGFSSSNLSKQIKQIKSTTHDYFVRKCHDVKEGKKSLFRIALGKSNKFMNGRNFDESKSIFFLTENQGDITLNFYKHNVLTKKSSECFQNFKVSKCTFVLKMRNHYEYSWLFSVIENLKKPHCFIVDFWGEYKIDSQNETIIATVYGFESISEYKLTANTLPIDNIKPFIEVLYSDSFEKLNLIEMENKRYEKKIVFQRSTGELWDNVKFEKLKKINLLIKSILKLNIFSNLKVRKETWKSTQIFTNDKNYSSVVKILKKIDEDFGITEEVTANEIVIRKADELYEFWILIKMLKILTEEMGWKLKTVTFGYESISGERIDLKKIIRRFFLPSRPFLKSKNCKSSEALKFCLVHSLRENENENVLLEIRYNDCFKAIYNESPGSSTLFTDLRPDYCFDFAIVDQFDMIKTDNKKKPCKKRIFLDAKYRNYKEQGKFQYYTDINDIALVKYIERFSVDVSGEGIKKDILDEIKENEPAAAFIIHSDYNQRFVDFGGSICSEFAQFIKDKYDDYKVWLNTKSGEVNNKNIRNYRYPKFKEYPVFHVFKNIFWSKKIDAMPSKNVRSILGVDDVLDVNHLFGGFFMVPSNVDHFRTFMLMIMEYFFKETELTNGKHLYDCCWQCTGDGNIEKRKILLNSGYHKYHLQCDCGAFWVINHCDIQGHLLIKHKENNYHKFEKDPWYVYCPQCNYWERISQRKNEHF